MLEEFRERKLTVLAALGELCDLARSAGAAGLSRRLDADLVSKLERDRFHLVVVGEFNHGKSSFVNALLGRRVLPVGVTPTTAVVHHIVYGDEPQVHRVDSQNVEHRLSFDDLGAFTARRGSDTEDIKYLEVSFPAPLLKERIVLVDTPGVNDLSLTRAEITYGYIPRSDAVLFVLDAGQPVKESERQFIQEQLIGKSRDKIVFVVAKSDLWSDVERTEALAYIEDRLGEVVKAPKIFPVSAQSLFDGAPERSGLDPLIDYLTKFLAEERGTILLNNALGEGLRAAALLTKAIDARRRALTMSAEQLQKRVALLASDLEGHTDVVETRRAMVREEAAAIKAWARRDLERFSDEFLEKLPEMLDSSSADDVRQHFGPYLEKAFKEWATRETQEIATSLEQVAERAIAMVREDAADVGQRVGQAMGADVVAPEISVDTFAADVGVFAMLSLGIGTLFANALLGGMLLVAAPVLALYNRDKTEALVKRRALEIAPSVIRGVAGKVGPKIDAMVDDFALRLDTWIVTAGQELHQEVIEVLQSVSNARVGTDEDKQREAAACDDLEKHLGRLSEQLTQLIRPRESEAAPGEAAAGDAAAGSEPAAGPSNGSSNGSGEA